MGFKKGLGPHMVWHLTQGPGHMFVRLKVYKAVYQVGVMVMGVCD